MKKFSRFTKLYIIFTILVITYLLLLLISNVSLYGFWSDKIYIWSWLITTFVFILKKFGNKLVKFYTVLLTGFLVLSFFPMGIPFITIISFLSGTDRNFTYHSESNLRLQMVSRGPLSVRNVEIVRETFPFEQALGTIPFEFEVEGKYLNVTPNIKNAKIIFLPGGIDSIKLEYETGMVTLPIHYYQ